MDASIERISIELTNACRKGCWFCYNGSTASGDTRWSLVELQTFVRSCAAGGVKAVSFGGGEPLEFPDWQPLLVSLRGVLFRSLTTNGLPLRDRACFDALVAAAPDKVHVSIHFPDRADEVERVVDQVLKLQDRGIRSGVNLLVSQSQREAAAGAARRVRAAGIDNRRITYLPMRMADTPTPAEMSEVAGREPFQSMTCLTECGRSPRFCSIGWDQQVAWCSYTRSRRPLEELSHAGLIRALHNLELEFCGHESRLVALA